MNYIRLETMQTYIELIDSLENIRPGVIIFLDKNIIQDDEFDKFVRKLMADFVTENLLEFKQYLKRNLHSALLQHQERVNNDYNLVRNLLVELEEELDE